MAFGTSFNTMGMSASPMQSFGASPMGGCCGGSPMGGGYGSSMSGSCGASPVGGYGASPMGGYGDEGGMGGQMLMMQQMMMSMMSMMAGLMQGAFGGGMQNANASQGALPMSPSFGGGSNGGSSNGGIGNFLGSGSGGSGGGGKVKKHKASPSKGSGGSRSGGGGGSSSVGQANAASAMSSVGSAKGAGWGKDLAKYAGSHATGSGGWCFKYAANALRKFGVNTSGASAYMAAPQLAKSKKFKEVKMSGNDLKKLPAGAVVVWNRGNGHQHGHISIALGNGKEASDVLRPQTTNYGTSCRVFIPK